MFVWGEGAESVFYAGEAGVDSSRKKGVFEAILLLKLIYSAASVIVSSAKRLFSIEGEAEIVRELWTFEAILHLN